MQFLYFLALPLLQITTTVDLSVADVLGEVTTATTDIIPWWPVVAVAVIVIGVAMRRILPWAMKRLG